MTQFSRIVGDAVRKRLLPLVEEVASQWKGCYATHDAPVAARSLADILARQGITGVLVSGHYCLDFWPDGPRSDCNLHSWIEAEGLILDPFRRHVFGLDELVLPLDDEAAGRYVGEHTEPF